MRMFLPILSAVACVPKAPAAQTQSMAPSANVFLRNTFDTDPSSYLGRFLPAGLSDLDESSAMPLACSKHISTRTIGGGEVSYAENLSVSSQVGVKLGIPLTASAEGHRDSTRTARVEYQLTRKMVAQIDDPEAFAACCKSQPDQCSDRYIGEFIEGTGALYHQSTTAVGAKLSGTVPQYATTGSASVSSDSAWERSVEFPNPVYFAFKITPTPYIQGIVSTCPDWVDNPPHSDSGVYIVGSAEAKTEENARSQALSKATQMSIRTAGLLTEMSFGVLPGLRAESWCVEPSAEKEDRYTARVLAFLSNDEIASARAKGAIAAEKAAAEAASAQAEAQRLAAPPALAQPAAQPAAGEHDIDNILAIVGAESFSANKLSALSASVMGAEMTCAEARRLLDLFAQSADKMEALKAIRMRITDRENWQIIVDGFSFSADREKVHAMLAGMEERAPSSP